VAGDAKRVNIDQAIAMRINYDIGGSESRTFSGELQSWQTALGHAI
jgi:hypothetical protein